jgi:hypothetical protein
VGDSESACSVYFKIHVTATSSYTARPHFNTFSPTLKKVLYAVHKRERWGEIKRGRGRETVLFGLWHAMHAQILSLIGHWQIGGLSQNF